MPTHPLCNFSLENLTSMVKQMFDYTKRGDASITFWTVNSHIPANRRDGITRDILGPLVDNRLTFNNWRPRWPIDFPIFSPYATTKDNTTSQYSQVRWSGDGNKYYCHLVAYAHQHGRMSFGTDQEISHTRFCGKRTSRNINPNHTIAEAGEYNKARHHCFLYMDTILLRQFRPEVNYDDIRKNISQQRVQAAQDQFNTKVMPTCADLHRMKTCSVDFWTWLADHKEDAQEEYSTQYETEAEADQRLLGERDFAGSPGSWGGNYPSSMPPPFYT